MRPTMSDFAKLLEGREALRCPRRPARSRRRDMMPAASSAVSTAVEVMACDGLIGDDRKLGAGPKLS